MHFRENVGYREILLIEKYKWKTGLYKMKFYRTIEILQSLFYYKIKNIVYDLLNI